MMILPQRAPVNYNDSMNIIVIRHGETQMNIDERLQGCIGPNEPLTQKGRVMITSLRDTLVVSPAIIYTSPLLRARETSHILNERFNVPIAERSELCERDFGSLSGAYKRDVSPQLLEDDLEGHYDYRPYGGESVYDVRARVIAFLSSLSLVEEITVFAVTHRGVIRILYDLYPMSVLPKEVGLATVHAFEITTLPQINT
jgi:broad specificity phosphatase PhoE